jgi:hypothetical protein
MPCARAYEVWCKCMGFESFTREKLLTLPNDYKGEIKK